MADTLITPRLRLRRFTAADAAHLHALDNDPAVMRYLNGGEPVSRAAIEQDILPTLLLYSDAQPWFGFRAIEHRATADFLGWVSLRPTDEPGEAALGYRLRQAAWGQGYAVEAARALLDAAFADADLRRAVATTYEHNTASIRVMEKLGMTLRGRFRYTPEQLAAADTLHTESAEVWDGDDVIYAIEAADWFAHQEEHHAG